MFGGWKPSDSVDKSAIGLAGSTLGNGQGGNAYNGSVDNNSSGGSSGPAFHAQQHHLPMTGGLSGIGMQQNSAQSAQNQELVGGFSGVAQRRDDSVTEQMTGGFSGIGEVKNATQADQNQNRVGGLSGIGETRNLEMERENEAVGGFSGIDHAKRIVKQ